MMTFLHKNEHFYAKAQLILIKEIQCPCLLRGAGFVAKKNVKTCLQVFTKNMLLAR
jgi:hypothetical protein